MNFTLADILYSCWAFALFALFLIPPGYALGWLLDLISFRKQDAGIRFLLSLPLSIALMPVVVYLAGRYSFDWPVWAMYGVLLGIFIVFCKVQGLRVSWMVWVASGVWIAVSFLSLVDLQIGGKVYYTVVAYDLNFRSAVTGAFERAHTLPVANPFFTDGTPQPFRYHYFWFMLCSLPVRLSQAVFGYTGLSPRHAVIASSAWAGLAIFSVAALYGIFFFEWAESVRRRLIWVAILLFGLSGLDIIPALAESWDGFFPTLDWWNSDQVTGWLDTMLWVPHSLGSLAACLMGFLILWKRPRFRWQEVLAAGLAFASAAGLSVYVTLVFALVSAAWTVRLAIARQWMRVSAWSLAGLAAVVLALPFLRELAGKPGSQGSFLVIEARHFQPASQLLDALDWWTPLTSGIANILCLPLGYFLELGFFAIVGWFAIWRRPRSEAESAARLMLVAALGFLSFVRSHTIQMNDFGARGMLIPQFILVLWGAMWLAENGKRSWLVRFTLVVGIVTSGLELLTLRLYPVLADHEIINGAMEIDPDENLGLRDYSARLVYGRLDRVLPASAVVQHNPSGAQDLMAGLYSNRQFAIMDLPTAVTFTGDPTSPKRVLAPLVQLFAGERQDPVTVCRQLGIDVLVVKDVDPVWSQPESWVWKAAPLAKADRMIALGCNAPAPQQPGDHAQAAGK
jgi:hypothetical protein